MCWLGKMGAGGWKKLKFVNYLEEDQGKNYIEADCDNKNDLKEDCDNMLLTTK